MSAALDHKAWGQQMADELRKAAAAQSSDRPDDSWMTDNPDIMPTPVEDGVSYNDFFAYMPMHNYIFAPSGEAYVGLAEERRRETLEALKEAEAGRVVEHGEVETWAATLKPGRRARQRAG